MLTNKLNKGLPLQKIVRGVEIHWLSGKEKISSVVVCKKGHADSVLRHGRSHRYWFA